MVTIITLNIDWLSPKVALLGALTGDLATVDIVVSIIALQEAKLDSGAHLLIAADLPGFTFTRKDGK